MAQASSNLPEGHECSICMTEINLDDSFKTICQHTFHKNCLDEWRKNSQSCPLCRQELPFEFIPLLFWYEKDLNTTVPMAAIPGWMHRIPEILPVEDNGTALNLLFEDNDTALDLLSIYAQSQIRLAIPWFAIRGDNGEVHEYSWNLSNES